MAGASALEFADACYLQVCILDLLFDHTGLNQFSLISIVSILASVH